MYLEGLVTKFLEPKFSVGGASSDAYRDGWERIFGKKKVEEKPDEEHAPISDVEFDPEETPEP